MTEHRIKTRPEYYEAEEDGSKPFTIRKNDRDYKVGDIVVIEEWDPTAVMNDRGYTGRSCRKRITYMTDFMQPQGQVVMGLENADPDNEALTLPRAKEPGISILDAAQRFAEETKPVAPPSLCKGCGAQVSPGRKLCYSCGEKREGQKKIAGADWGEDYKPTCAGGCGKKVTLPGNHCVECVNKKLRAKGLVT